MATRKMHLGLMMTNFGRDVHGWQYLGQRAATDIEHYKRLARMCEDAKFDMVFRADEPYAEIGNLRMTAMQPRHTDTLEPLTLLAALSQHTSRIGLGATVTTTYSYPFTVARQLVSVDHLSGGRIAWNIVTSGTHEAAGAYGQDTLPTSAERYARATEFLEVVKRLMDSYEDDAVIQDADSGLYFDPAKIHPVHYEGKYIKMHAALNCSRGPQGYPVIVQAGQSEPGIALAASAAELIYATGGNYARMKAYESAVRKKLLEFGRSRDSVKIMPSLGLYLGETKADAEALRADSENRVPLELRVHILSEDFGVNLSRFPLDQPLPEEIIPKTNEGFTTFFKMIVDMIKARMPLRDMAFQYRRGFDSIVGSPTEIADIMEEWHANEVCDGYMLSVSYKSVLKDFCEQVVPELQRRGLFRTEYEGTTLREHFGLQRPPNSNLAAPAPPAKAVVNG